MKVVVLLNTITTKTTKCPMSNVFAKVFDHNTESWHFFLIKNFKKFNTTELVITDFGMMNYPDDFTYIDMSQNNQKVGFKNLLVLSKSLN